MCIVGLPCCNQPSMQYGTILLIQKISKDVEKADVKLVPKQGLQYHSPSHITMHPYISSCSRFQQVRLAAIYLCRSTHGYVRHRAASNLVCVPSLHNIVYVGTHYRLSLIIPDSLNSSILLSKESRDLLQLLIYYLWMAAEYHHECCTSIGATVLFSGHPYTRFLWLQ